MFKQAKNIKLSVVSANDKPAVIERKTDRLILGPLVNLDGSLNFLCGNCNFKILKNVDEDYAKSFSFRCPKCHRLNSYHTN